MVYFFFTWYCKGTSVEIPWWNLLFCLKTLPYERPILVVTSVPDLFRYFELNWQTQRGSTPVNYSINTHRATWLPPHTQMLVFGPASHTTWNPAIPWGCSSLWRHLWMLKRVTKGVWLQDRAEKTGFRHDSLQRKAHRLMLISLKGHFLRLTEETGQIRLLLAHWVNTH